MALDKRLLVAAFVALAVLMLADACSKSRADEPHSAAQEPSTSSSKPADSARSSAPPVPDRYKTAYAELDSALTKFEATLPAGGPDLNAIGAVSSSLIMANSNSGPSILRPAPAVFDVALQYLDQMQKLGSSAVEIQVSYPVASKDFPNQAAYFDFYRRVVDEAHRRGFKVLIETSCIFYDSPFSDVQFDFSRLDAQRYFQARTDQIVAIARDIGPDYLAIGEEPVNERVFAGIDYAPDQYVAFVNGAADAVRRELGDGASRVRVGAGTGTWEYELYQRFVHEADLDFYDIHIYPLQGNPGGLETARDMARLAEAKGKPAIIGETWLYKLASAEIGRTAGATAAEAFRRDAFTFWEPLEARYMRDVLALGAEFKMPFVSFWGARFFFGQVDWTPELDALDFRGVSAAVNPTIMQGITAGTRTTLGDAFAALMGR
jgi:hypothetical protein